MTPWTEIIPNHQKLLLFEAKDVKEEDDDEKDESNNNDQNKQVDGDGEDEHLDFCCSPQFCDFRTN